jgi:genome maintenance exonuclease 1
MDHKTARKMKNRSDILNYRDQLAAYALAHNNLYNTNIKTGVIFMVDRDFNFQEFFYDINELAVGETAWINRLENYITKNPISE